MNDLRVLGLNGFGLTVPDLEKAEHFYRAFGLEVGKRGDGLGIRSPGRSHDEGLLIPGSGRRLHHLSFYIDPIQTDAFSDKLTAMGLAVSDKAPDNAHRKGLWFQDRWGTWINLSPEIPRSIAAESPPQPADPVNADRIDVALWQQVRPGRPPRRIGHLLMFTQDWEATERFYCEALGMRTTDRAVGKVAFMAAGTGIIDHHCFGLINSTHRGLQHASFNVANIDDIGLGAVRMRAAGYTEGDRKSVV